MQKIVLILLILSGCSHSSHLQRLNESYPNGRIGDDYGILTRDDLAVNTCNFRGANPSSLEGSAPYPYWQCFFVKDVFISCEEDEQSKEPTLIMGISAVGQARHHIYVSRQVMTLNRCLGFKKDLKKLTEHQTHICISGEFIRYEPSDKTVWVFDKFKTKKGCASYWDDCDLKIQIKKGCQPRFSKE
jgi:hypothetical protein